MPDTIAGYIDRSRVKGQTYRYAGCPVPTVFTGDIDVVSDDLLSKAMTVTNDGTHGTFPRQEADKYLVTTTEYGDSTYLQSAINCSDRTEYRRIKSGTNDWTQWVSVSAVVDQFNGRIGTLETTVNGNDSTTGLTTKTSDLENYVVNGIGDKAGLWTRVDTIEKAKYGENIANLQTSLNEKIKQIVITQNVSMRTAGEVNGRFQLGTELVYPKNASGTKTGILIGMRVNTAQIAAINGTVYMLCYSENGTKPYINYQKGSGVTFSNVSHEFIFTFYIP